MVAVRDTRAWHIKPSESSDSNGLFTHDCVCREAVAAVVSGTGVEVSQRVTVDVERFASVDESA